MKRAALLLAILLALPAVAKPKPGEFTFALPHVTEVRTVKGHRGPGTLADKDGMWILIDEGAYLLMTWDELDLASNMVRGRPAGSI